MISVLTIVFNLILTGIFVVWVEKLARSAYQLEMAERSKDNNTVRNYGDRSASCLRKYFKYNGSYY